MTLKQIIVEYLLGMITDAYIYVQGVPNKSTFPFLIKEIQITFDSKKLESKFKLLQEAQSTL